MDNKMKIGVIGAGRIGTIHIQNIMKFVPDVKVKAVIDIFPEKVKEWGAKLDIPKISDDYKDVLGDPEIGAVLICSSTDTHSNLIIEAAKADKHIFCEKPIDYDIARIKKALDEVEKAGVKLQVGFNRRFDHNFGRVRNAIEEGKVGNIHIIKITSRDPEPPSIDYIKNSGGLFMDMTIHDFDMARFLAGSEVEEVFAHGAVLVNPAIGEAGDIDTAIINLKFRNGTLGVIDNSRKAIYGYDQRVEVFGSNGCLSTSNDTNSSVVLSNSEGVTGEKPKFFFLERYMDSYRKEIVDFFGAILNNKSVPVTGIDGLKPVLIGRAALKSLTEGRAVKVE
jgi:Predicted dehydrogenases and related proteins